MTPEDQQHIAIDTTAIEKPQSPKIFADIASSFTYASYQNAILVLRGIGIENRSDRQVESLRLELSSTPAFVRPKTWTIDRVVPGDRLPLGDRKVELDAGYLAGLNEAERGEITLRLVAGSEILDEHRHAVRLLARDEWGSVADMAQLLSVLTRLAFARLLAKDGRPAPVILDDALVYSDDDRIEKMFDALHRQAREQQIIVFSCRQRAFQKLGGRNVLQMLDWTPDE